MSNQTVPLTKRFIIEIDVVTGHVSYDNPDELTYLQVCGMLEYVRLMIAREFLKDSEE